jgi:glycosyltransferase involved in cell wall biosynthesis
MRIAYVWTNGIRNKDRFDRWNDGVRAAVRLLEKDHEITFHEPDEEIPAVDWILFHEAPCTYESSQDGHKYRKLLANPQRKALLFAGGPVKKQWVEGFNHVFVESKINKDEFDALGIPNSTAFGVNTDVFKPLGEMKKYKTVTHGAFAGWKRQHLVAAAMGKDALIFGRYQPEDPFTYDESIKYGATVLGEQSYEETARLLNHAFVSVNAADFWGGGQRATLEAMACGIPVIVMQDSPKNREYVEESGVGIICDPHADSIRRAVDDSFSIPWEGRKRAYDYVQSKWTHHHYAEAIMNGIS